MGALHRVAPAVPAHARRAADVDVGAPPERDRAGRETAHVRVRAARRAAHTHAVLEAVAQLDELVRAVRAGQRGERSFRGAAGARTLRDADWMSGAARSCELERNDVIAAAPAEVTT